ncbi:hypothetical protein RhiirA4_455480 [Rhizophagus irregularis]|uniref:Uncharacterized protein n=1 Tax=Rhizophagus irregularis TaxID=588596 RepID=A0A2I1G5F4_9GLOM|nr:hypothetical protein RhiirA4_455480 [Rhizophagus irregularis]
MSANLFTLSLKDFFLIHFIFSEGHLLPSASKASRDFSEELKCLFLCVRNPPKCALEETATVNIGP